MMMEEAQFLTFRLWKEHKGIVILFGLFTMLFSAFYLILIGGWQAEGAAVILSCSVTAMFPFVYDANNVVRLGMLGTGRKHDRSIAVSALAGWARAAGIDNKTIPSGLLAFVLWLLIAATVCLYGYHFYRCFRLYFWNETWEAAYREKLGHSGVAPNISMVPFPEW